MNTSQQKLQEHPEIAPQVSPTGSDTVEPQGTPPHASPTDSYFSALDVNDADSDMDVTSEYESPVVPSADLLGSPVLPSEMEAETGKQTGTQSLTTPLLHAEGSARRDIDVASSALPPSGSTLPNTEESSGGENTAVERLSLTIFAPQSIVSEENSVSSATTLRDEVDTPDTLESKSDWSAESKVAPPSPPSEAAAVAQIDAGLASIEIGTDTTCPPSSEHYPSAEEESYPPIVEAPPLCNRLAQKHLEIVFHKTSRAAFVCRLCL